MAAWLDAIMSPLKTAGEMAQGLIEIRDTVKFGDAVIKLQAQIMSAQQGALAAQSRETEMTEEIRSLKTHVAELEAWDAQKDRYDLKRLEPGVFVYSLKPDMAAGEPPHYICQTCYQHGKRSILQSLGAYNGQEKFDCHECKTRLATGIYTPPPSRGGPRRGSWMSR
jgi:hypothetical protein